MVSALTTQIKQQEKLRAEAEKEKMRSNLLRAVSHDIRTPLTSIVGGVNAILDSGDRMTPETQTALLTDIRTEAQWLVGVVENLLRHARISGASTIHKELEAGRAAQRRERQVPQALPGDHGRHPRAGGAADDPDGRDLIEQVLINLMENAALHGGSTTRIELHLRREGDPRSLRSRTMERASHRRSMPLLFTGAVSSAADESADGKRNMGIGLSVCMTIVQAHGGAMAAENSALGGALFQFSHCHWRRTIMTIRDKILIIEDEPTIANFMRAILEARDYEVMIVQSGAMASTLIASHCPDLIILDLGLPDMDGMQLLKAVRQWSKVPVVVVSARSHERDKVAALDAGADDYLTKPSAPRSCSPASARLSAIPAR